MKRAPELRELSRDHHQALSAALALRRAGTADSAEAVDGFLDFWNAHGERHFEIEEAVLLPGYVLGGGDPRHELVAKVLTDHVEIRARAREMRSEPAIAELHALGEKLTEHVRLEENDLFPLIERTLGADALAALGDELARAERSRSRSKYPGVAEVADLQKPPR